KARTKKLQEVQVLSLTGLINTKKNQVVVNRVRCKGGSHHLPPRSEELDGVLGIVIVPGNAVVVQEDKQLVFVFQHSLLVLLCQFRAEIPGEQAAEVPFDLNL